MGNTEMKEESGMMMIQIQIQEADKGHRILSFATEKSLPLRRVFLDFCDQLDLVYSTVRFTHDGSRINEKKTAEECGIEDGEVIDAFYEQVGGGINDIIPLSS